MISQRASAVRSSRHLQNRESMSMKLLLTLFVISDVSTRKWMVAVEHQVLMETAMATAVSNSK